MHCWRRFVDSAYAKVATDTAGMPALSLELKEDGHGGKQKLQVSFAANETTVLRCTIPAGPHIVADLFRDPCCHGGIRRCRRTDRELAARRNPVLHLRHGAYNRLWRSCTQACRGADIGLGNWPFRYCPDWTGRRCQRAGAQLSGSRPNRMTAPPATEAPRRCE